ncbi:hypothetical protein BJ684DRAFT_19578 [Piptocephalis cylindrospora]|uniref:FHA domain-containing protein n=1 Tax=Piptocephalis cylindrospora TaxID=1907219 RepID=A0A4V1IYB5_9FUNG|nr:hypothetical protein BJ684DRAFT_19578 [Piptocephalis cylindrospora]|eukprot:RKP13979.1 hypothetical protein BJ684DRAFT_19578 [Piptocephalis cylindrospora]
MTGKTRRGGVQVRLTPFTSSASPPSRGFQEAPIFQFTPIEKRISSRRPVILGRAPWTELLGAWGDEAKRSITLPSELVMPNHAVLQAVDGNLYISDMFTPTGTFVNHVPVTPIRSSATLLKDGDCIQLGTRGVNEDGVLHRVRIHVGLSELNMTTKRDPNEETTTSTEVSGAPLEWMSLMSDRPQGSSRCILCSEPLEGSSVVINPLEAREFIHGDASSIFKLDRLEVMLRALLEKQNVSMGELNKRNKDGQGGWDGQGDVDGHSNDGSAHETQEPIKVEKVVGIDGEEAVMSSSEDESDEEEDRDYLPSVGPGSESEECLSYVESENEQQEEGESSVGADEEYGFSPESEKEGKDHSSIVKSEDDGIFYSIIELKEEEEGRGVEEDAFQSASSSSIVSSKVSTLGRPVPNSSSQEVSATAFLPSSSDQMAIYPTAPSQAAAHLPGPAASFAEVFESLQKNMPKVTTDFLGQSASSTSQAAPMTAFKRPTFIFGLSDTHPSQTIAPKAAPFIPPSFQEATSKAPPGSLTLTVPVIGAPSTRVSFKTSSTTS